MNKFGVVKSKLIKKLTESFSSQNKSEMKEILKTIKENKNFKEMYVFYEEIENKTFDDKEVAQLYVEELNNILKTKTKELSEFCKTLNEKLGDIVTDTISLYDNLDQLSEEDTLSNIEKKVLAKKSIVNHLLEKKEESVNVNESHTKNESLLLAVLANNFNILYNNTLSEEEKTEFKKIISFTDEELNNNTNQLKESIVSKVDALLSENKDQEFIDKLKSVKENVLSMNTSRYNYGRLLELKGGLD